MTIEYVGKADTMLAEYTSMLERCDTRNARAKALLAEAEELAAESRELANEEFMASPADAADIAAHRAILNEQIDAKSGEVMRLHQETFEEWERFNATWSASPELSPTSKHSETAVADWRPTT
ncbi:hypothetical protein OHB26_01485 [Nocardia sp. NBC_01503]|uniref:hypothetical protein n=1 Tax=Nocardia sp. NBC_01503 TaxID=2975997 RepID=UPI002E7B7356|nr:hypothetical protein [Nocardia sp. NBC_01503]WTL32958.1 hypothetical protein OHB26_01485 [Nocardia sp. NBC_01503]